MSRVAVRRVMVVVLGAALVVQKVVRMALRVLAMAVHLLVGRVALLGAVRVVQKVVRMVLRVLAMATLLGAVQKVVRMVLRVLAMATHLREVRAAAAAVKVQAGL